MICKAYNTRRLSLTYFWQSVRICLRTISACITYIWVGDLTAGLFLNLSAIQCRHNLPALQKVPVHTKMGS